MSPINGAMKRSLILLLLAPTSQSQSWDLVSTTPTQMQNIDYFDFAPTMFRSAGKILLFYAESQGSPQGGYRHWYMLRTCTSSCTNWSNWKPYTGSGTIVFGYLTNIGSGYSSRPSCSITAPAGSGATCAFGPPVNGAIPSITLTSGGSGYNSSTPVTCAITDSTGTGASCFASPDSSGAITLVRMLTYGSNYTNPNVTIGGSGRGATATLGAPVNGAITSFTITNPGSGYNPGPTIGVTAHNALGVPPFGGNRGRDAEFLVSVSKGAVTSTVMVNGGSQYRSPSLLSILRASETLDCQILGGRGSGGACSCTVSGGAATKCSITAGGKGYVAGPAVSASGGGGGSHLAASVNTTYCYLYDPTGCFYDANGLYDVGSFGGGVSPSGAVIAAFINRDPDASFNPHGGIIMRSTDGGNTWSTPAALGGPHQYNSVYGQMVSIPSRSSGVTAQGCASGCLILNVRDHDARTQDLLFSYDDGLTWGNETIIHGGAHSTDESAFTWLGGNRLLGFNRNGATVGYMYELYTPDLGSTWTANITNLPLSQSYACPAGQTPTLFSQIAPMTLTPPSVVPAGMLSLSYGQRISCNFLDIGKTPILGTTFPISQAISSPTRFAQFVSRLDIGQGNQNAAGYSWSVPISSSQLLVLFSRPFDNAFDSNIWLYSTICG